MKRVTGIGGIFFHAQDPATLSAWYQRHLGLDVQPYGGAAFTWTDAYGKPTGDTTIWSAAANGNDRSVPGKTSFMINYRVNDLDARLQALRDEVCQVLEKAPDSEYRQFGWVIDSEGNKVELCQPLAGQ